MFPSDLILLLDKFIISKKHNYDLSYNPSIKLKFEFRKM